MMKLLQLLFIPVLLSFAIIQPETEPKQGCKNSQYILKQSQLKHDPDQHWAKAELNLHIQEPRVQNPGRYSKVKLNNGRNAFEFERNREEGAITCVIDENGSFSAMLEGASEMPKDIVEKYGLNKDRIDGYWKFYQLMYGLPMSMNTDFYERMDTATTVQWQGKEAYKIDVELKEPMISKNWSLLISTADYRMLGIELNSPDSPDGGEYLVFDGEMTSNGLTIPRIRHWYGKNSGEYLGSDIIMKEIE